MRPRAASAASISPELLLAAACCASTRISGTRSLGGHAGNADPERFAAVLEVHRVSGLVARAFREAGLGTPASLRESATAIAKQNLQLAAESARLNEALNRREIPHLFIKGTTLAVVAYGELGSKHARDIDLLVAPEDMARGARVLMELGYQRLLPAPELDEAALSRWVAAYKETIWRHRDHGAIVELHNGLVDNPRLLRGVDVHSPSHEVEIGGGLSLPTLRTDLLFAYLCVHGAGHGWSRLKWLADVNALLARVGDVQSLLQAAAGLGAGPAAGQALLLCHRLFALPLPPELLGELRASRAIRTLEHVALRALANGGGAVELDRRPLDTAAIMLSHFLLGGWSFRVAEFRRKLVHPHDRAHIALPRTLAWLYPLLLVPAWQVRRARRVRQEKAASVANSSAISQPITSTAPDRTQT